MKQLDQRVHHFKTLHIIITVLAFNILGLSAHSAIAQETPSAAPDGIPRQTQATSDPGATTASTEDMQTRLNNLQQRLDKVGTKDLDPISLLLPNISSNVPNAYGASQGMVAVGLGLQNRLRYTDHRADGTASAVIGLGNPQTLGADIQVSFLDLSHFGHRDALGFKLHRQLGDDYTVAVGGENSLVSSYSDSGASYYAVVSKKLRLAESSRQPFSRVYLSLGVGNGRFLSQNDVFRNKGGIDVFGSAAVNVNRSTMAFAEWTGQSLNAGASVVPFRKYPFSVTLALADIAGNGGDGTRFTAGFGYVFTR